MDAKQTSEHQDWYKTHLPEDLLHSINCACDEGCNAGMANVFKSGNELDILLITTTALCKTGMDKHSELTKVFMEKTLFRLYNWIHDDYDIIKEADILQDIAIISRTEQLIRLIVIKLSDDYLPLLNLLAVVFDPQSRFYICNEFSEAESLPSKRSQSTDIEPIMYAVSDEKTKPKGIIVDMINLFGNLGGFRCITERFQGDPVPSLAITAAILRPFGQCYELLTTDTVSTYFVPVLDKTCEILDNLSENELQYFSQSEDLAEDVIKPDAINTMLVDIESIASRIPPGGARYNASNMQLFRMKMTLRLKQARGLPYGRCDTESDPPNNLNVRGTCSSRTSLVDELQTHDNDSSFPLQTMEVNSCDVAQVTVIRPGDADIPLTPPSNYSDEYSTSDLNDTCQRDSLIQSSANDQLIEGAMAATVANATPVQNGERYSSFFDMGEEGSHQPSGRWSANSSDISGATSKSYSVRSNGHDLCRFCYEGEQSTGNRMIRPCRCSGSAAYVHSRCLKKWIHFSRNTQCEVCHSHFTYVPYSERIRAFLEEFRRNKRWRNATFATLVGLVVLLYLVIFAVFPGGIIDV